MSQTLSTMRAVALSKFGDADELALKTIPVPSIDPSDVLIRVEYAGVGVWDVFEREGGYAEMLGLVPKFPYVLGSEGAGSIVAIGENVRDLGIGDRVFAPGFLNPKGGFYAEYAAIDSAYVSLIPERITIQEASVVSGVGITALRGLQDVLRLRPGETVLVFGASGGVGHVAAQLAKSMGARVFAVASGEDGVAMVKSQGIEAVVDGHKDDILRAARSFAPQGLDAALLTAGGEVADRALLCVRTGGRVAFPNGVYPEPKAPSGVMATGYYGDPEPDIIHRLHGLINSSDLTVHIDRTFPLENAREAHLALNNHYLGKLALRINQE